MATERPETNPLSVKERLFEATQNPPPGLRKKMEEALRELDKGLPLATHGAVLGARVTL